MWPDKQKTSGVTGGRARAAGYEAVRSVTYYENERDKTHVAKYARSDAPLQPENSDSVVVSNLVSERPEYSSIDVGAAYRDLRIRILALVDGITHEEWERPVPHCPEWTIRETLAHLAGIVDDGINNNMVGVTTPPWTAAQIAKRTDHSGPQIAEEWATYAPFVEARATERGMAMSQMVFDAYTHEHDIRHALGRPGSRDSSASIVALGFIAGRAATREGGFPIQAIVGGAELFQGCQPDAPTLTASAFDLLRSIGSRRARIQVESLSWSKPPGAALDSFSAFGYPATEIAE
jgi:uncharacterized protein (TIGR03083 family)